MKNNIARIVVISILALATVNCERAATDSSRVSLQLPTYSKVSSQACTKCLKVIFANISGDFKTIRFNERSPHVDEAATELSSEITLDVPSGPGRTIQILAIYRLSDSTLEIQYGSTVADLFGETPPPVFIGLKNLGVFKTGSIVGRYLTGVDSGPTGKVIVSMTHAASGLSMDLFDREILNGWFEFFGSENFPMSYRLADGTLLAGLQNVSLDSLTPASGTNHRVRFYRPTSYYRYNSAVWQPVKEFHDIIYGYFGDTSAASKFVCLDDSTSTVFSAISTSANGVSGDITYNHNTAVTNGVYGVGGIGVTTGGANCVSGDTTSYANNRITIQRDQFNGKGNDTANAISGAFTFSSVNGIVNKYTVTGSVTKNYTFKTLPGLFATAGALFDGVKLFEKANSANSGVDDIRCDDSWLTTNGFAEFTSFNIAPSVTIDAVAFSLAAPPATNGYILCPTSAGAMTGMGGLYIGGL